MNNWIKNITKLTGETVDLIPLEIKHFKTLDNLAKDIMLSLKLSATSFKFAWFTFARDY